MPLREKPSTARCHVSVEPLIAKASLKVERLAARSVEHRPWESASEVAECGETQVENLAERLQPRGVDDAPYVNLPDAVSCVFDLAEVVGEGGPSISLAPGAAVLAIRAEKPAQPSWRQPLAEGVPPSTAAVGTGVFEFVQGYQPKGGVARVFKAGEGLTMLMHVDRVNEVPRRAGRWNE